MSLSSIGAASSLRDTSPPELRSSGDDATSSPFAAMLASYSAEPQRAELREPKRDEGTSELDNSSEDTDSTDDTSRASKAANVADRMAELGAAASGLAPGLKDKLARVVNRMKEEFGKDVTVNEGIRSQARQNALFAQGRTVDGPVVTWTKNSLHSKGLAADLMVDGGFTDAQGFADLQRVAREEGLHTLGKMDPGHVELRAGTEPGEFIEGLGANVGASLKKIVPLQVSARMQSPAQVAQVASVAQVAVPTPAKVAGVARVAQVSVASANVVNAKRADEQSRGKDAGTRDGDSRGEQRGKGSPSAPAADPTTGNLRAYAAMSRPDAAGIGDDASISSLSNASSAANRVEQVMDLQESRAPKVLSHLNVTLDDGQGGQDVVRIGMRGNGVGATFDMRDAAGATRVSARLGELTSALERRGLEPQGFTVRHTGHSAELDAVSTRATLLSTSDSSATHHDDQGSARGFNRQAPDRDDQAHRRHDADERRRRSTMFSLNTEEA